MAFYLRKSMLSFSRRLMLDSAADNVLRMRPASNNEGTWFMFTRSGHEYVVNLVFSGCSIDVAIIVY